MPDKKVVFNTPWFFIEKEFFHGKPWYRIVEPNAVCVLAMTKDQKIVLIRQFRPIINEYTLELPAGHIDNNEDAVSCARRELHEETGYVCDKWVCLASNVPMLAGRSTMRADFLFGSDAFCDASFVLQENSEVKLATLSEFKNLILSGECKQSIAASLLQLASWRELIPNDF